MDECFVLVEFDVDGHFVEVAGVTRVSREEQARRWVGELPARRKYFRVEVLT